jgi:hypothetical protein
MTVVTTLIFLIGIWGVLRIKQIDDENLRSIADLAPKKIWGGYLILFGSERIRLIEGRNKSKGANVRLSLPGSYPFQMIAYRKARGVFHANWLQLACRHRSEVNFGGQIYIIKTDSPQSAAAFIFFDKSNLLPHLLREELDVLYANRSKAVIFFDSYSRFWNNPAHLIKYSSDFFNGVRKMKSK